MVTLWLPCFHLTNLSSNLKHLNCVSHVWLGLGNNIPHLFCCWWEIVCLASMRFHWVDQPCHNHGVFCLPCVKCWNIISSSYLCGFTELVSYPNFHFPYTNIFTNSWTDCWIKCWGLVLVVCSLVTSNVITHRVLEERRCTKKKKRNDRCKVQISAETGTIWSSYICLVHVWYDTDNRVWYFVELSSGSANWEITL